MTDIFGVHIFFHPHLHPHTQDGYAYVEQQHKQMHLWAAFSDFSFFDYSDRQVTKGVMLLRVKSAYFNALEKFSF
jgi:hypothetical protein